MAPIRQKTGISDGMKQVFPVVFGEASGL